MGERGHAEAPSFNPDLTDLLEQLLLVEFLQEYLRTLNVGIAKPD